MKALVTYFSASGVTAALANRMAEAIEAPAYEIRPAVPYTKADLDWMDKKSRSTVEMNDKSCRPALADMDAPVADADVIFVGYPVWWYREPSIIDSFLETYDFTGKDYRSACRSSFLNLPFAHAQELGYVIAHVCVSGNLRELAQGK